MSRFRFSLMMAAAICLSTVSMGQSDCSSYNYVKGPFQHGKSDTYQHLTGQHWWTNSTQGNCNYSGGQSNVPVNCATHSVASSGSAAYDQGPALPWFHSVNQQDANASADVPGGVTPAAVTAYGAAAANGCLFVPCDIPTITIKSGSVSVTPTPIWQDSWNYSNTCQTYVLPPAAPVCTPSGPPPYQATLPNYWYWDTSTCEYVLATQESPIIIDTTNTGFSFTDPAQGAFVTFDMNGDGKLLKFSWPKAGSGNAWLVYDRDGDGVIKDGTELFGNFTPHSDGGVPNHPNPNGFLALAWYDKPDQGGDLNLILDKNDKIWQKLRLWFDDHCYKTPDVPCRSLPQELHTLESAGINSISLVYDVSSKQDAVGNDFKFFTRVNPLAETIPVDEQGHSCCDLHQKSKDPRLAYDVFLKYVQ